MIFNNILVEGTRNGLTKPKAIRGTGVKMIAMGEIFAHSRISDIEMDRVPVTEKEFEKSSIEEGDLLFARQSLTLAGAGKCSIVTKVTEPTVFESHLIRARINTKIAEPYYIYYYFNSFQGKENIKSIVEQVAAAGIRGSDLVKLEIPLPKLSDQKKAVSILQAIDNKIDLNEQINKNLEEQAQALFKSWFLDYDPWNGNVPDSWSSGKLGDFANIKRGGSPRPIQKYLADTGLRWLKISDVTSLQTPYVMDIKDHIIREGLNKTVFLKAGSLVLSNSATPGIPKILDVDSCIHDGWLYFPDSKLSNEYLYLYFKYIRQELVNLSNGSVFNNLKTDILKGYPTILPDKDTLERFNAIVKPIFMQMQSLTRESHKLTDIRDSLLPRLMSGELDVSGIDI